MKVLIPILLFPFFSEVTDGLKTSLLGRGQDVLSRLDCEPHSQGYIVPDPHHCDRFMVCGLSGRPEIHVCQGPEESFHLEQRLCLSREEAHCLKTGRKRRWNADTFGLQVRLYQDLKALKRLTRSLAEDILQEVQCEKDPEGYIVPDPHYCNRYLECDTDANSEVKLCDEGKSFNLDVGVCQDEKSVDCSTRTKKWKIIPSKTKKIRLFGRLRKPSISRSPVVTTISSIITSPSSPVAVTVSTPRAPAVQDSIVHHDPLVEAECEADGEVYVVPDPLHCDRYLICPAKTIELCDAGSVLDTKTGYCAPRARVHCGDRTLNMRNIQEQLEARLEAKVKGIARETEEINLFLSTSTTTKRPEVTTRKSSIRGFGTRVPNSPSTPASEEPSSLISEESSLRNFVFPTRKMKDSVLVKKMIPAKTTEKISQPAKTVPRTTGIKIVKNTFDISSAAVVTVTTAQESLEDTPCEEGVVGYKIGDPEQCDKYLHCSPAGVKTISLCPDGFAFSLAKSECDYLTKVDCTSRPKLQEPKSTKLCPRENGYFPVAAEISCSQYVDCRNGIGHVTHCGAGAVFDEISGCVHPDQTNRPGCTASEKYSFTCPTFGLSQRFGDHDRLPHPTDCSLFYACLRNGAPRLLSCEAPTVFNPESGFCEHQDKVPGCQGFYPELVPNLEKEKLTEQIREELRKELGLSR